MNYNWHRFQLGKNMKKLVISFLLLATFTLLNATYATTYNYVTPKAPYISPSIKGAVVKYKQKNFVGAMQDLEEALKKEPKNTAGLYYLALTYTQLGYQEKAKEMYQNVIDLNNNSVLAHYSKYALDCIGNPDSEQCSVYKSTPKSDVIDDDIAQFIKSGKTIHPSAMDKITNERMIRRIQEEEYQRKQNEINTKVKSDNSMPTNEEIVSAIKTLSKIGYNPLNNDTLSYGSLENFSLNSFPTNVTYSNPEYFKMLMFNQLTQQNNMVNNYGI